MGKGCGVLVGFVYWFVIAVIALVLLAGDVPAVAVVVLVLGWLVWFGITRLLRAATPASSSESVARPSEGGPSGLATPVHEPRPPVGGALDAWSPSTYATEVAGEFYRQDSFARLFPGLRPSAYGDGVEVLGPALLSDDSVNPYDSNAVAIWFRGEHVGYLDRETAKDYSPIVRALVGQGRFLQVSSRVWARKQDDGQFAARVTLYLPPPSGVVPKNSFPTDPYTILPSGGRVQVTKEEQHMDVLLDVVEPGRESPVVVTLHAVEEQRPRSTVDVVEVRYGGKRVGVLSPTMTSHVMPLVRYVEGRGRIAVARAAIAGSRLKADIVLTVAKASEVGDDWLDSVRPV